MHYYNWTQKHISADEVSKFDMKNFNDTSVIERVAIAIEIF